MQHPTDFYIAHAFIKLPTGDVWGCISDGPLDRREMEKLVIGFDHEDGAPSLENLYVLHVQSDAPARVVTEDMLHVWNDFWATEAA